MRRERYISTPPKTEKEGMVAATRGFPSFLNPELLMMTEWRPQEWMTIG